MPIVLVVQRMNNDFRLLKNDPMDSRVVYLLKAAKKTYPSPHIFAFEWQSNEKQRKQVKQLLNWFKKTAWRV